MDAARIPCAGGVIRDERGRILLIQRGQPPAQGRWSIPGGRCEPGEASADACVREVAEETGLSVGVIRLVGSVERSGPSGVTYLIDDWLCQIVGGSLRAGDDALDARWVSRAELADLPLAPLLFDALRDWDQLPD